MKRPTQHKHKNSTLVDKAAQAVIEKKVVFITANVCEQKDNCSLCDRGGFYGIPLVFVLHYADKSISTVCYKCGAKAARKAELKLPLTETDVCNRIEEEDTKRSRKKSL